MAAAQCSNPTQVPNQTISSGTYSFQDPNALSASSVVIYGSASVTFSAGNCIQLLPGFQATAGTAATTFRAWIGQQYYLTTAVNPPGGGTISPSSGWYSSGSVVTVSATANPGYAFSGFSGDLGGTTNPQNLTMNGPKTVTANFTTSNQPPQAVSVTPSSGSGLGPQAFQFLYSDANGYADLASLYGRVNATASDAGACSFRYDRASNYIYLYNDAGSAWLGPVTLGYQLTNSQCTLGAGSTTPNGNNLTLNLTITFKTAFAGGSANGIWIPTNLSPPSS